MSPARSFRAPLIILLVAAMLPAGGCREIAGSLGSSSEAARANVDRALYSLAVRFGPVTPAPGYDEIRSELSSSALVPSRLFQDSTLWSAASGDTRSLVLTGRPEPRGYVLGSRTPAGAPDQPGEYRRSMRLRRLSEGQFEWMVRDELAVGTLSSGEIGAALQKLLTAAEHSNGRQLRTAYQTQLPRTTRALSRLFVLDSIAVSPAAGGGALLFVTFRVDPERIAAELPDLSRFLRRYGTPLELEVVGDEPDGTVWWEASRTRNRTALRFRIHNGRLAPLNAPLRTIPDRIRIRGSVSTRIGVFDLGASDIVSQVTLHRDPARTGFSASFRQEPDWHFPPLTERLIRSFLRRPFAGEGAIFELRMERSSGRSTLVREYRMSVQESTILRWLGTLGSSTLNDFRDGAEQQYDRFVGEVFTALREDAAVLLR